MQVRVVGFIDEEVEVDEQLWNEAKNDEELEKLMVPYFTKLHVNLTFGKPGEFDEIGTD